MWTWAMSDNDKFVLWAVVLALVIIAIMGIVL